MVAGVQGAGSGGAPVVLVLFLIVSLGAQVFTAKVKNRQGISKRSSSKEQRDTVPISKITPNKQDNDDDDKRLAGAKNADIEDSREYENKKNQKSKEHEEDQGDIKEKDGKMWDGFHMAEFSGRPEKTSIAARLIARLVTLTTGHRPVVHRHNPLSEGPYSSKTNAAVSPFGRLWHFRRGQRGRSRVRWRRRGPKYHRYKKVQNDEHPSGKMLHRYGHLAAYQNNMQHVHHGVHHTPHIHPKMPNIHSLRLPRLPQVHGPSLHGLHSPSLPRNPHIQGPQPIPHMNSHLPKMYAPGMPDTQLTMQMLSEMIHEGKIPPINFNCNSNNHILHLVHQHEERDKKKRRRKRRSLNRWYEDNSSQSEETSGENLSKEDEEDDSGENKREEIEAKRLIPLLKRVEAKDIHALSRMIPHHGVPRPIIHHHGPRILLVCISNTYLSTLIEKYKGSSSNESN